MKATVIMFVVVYILTLTGCGEETTTSNSSGSATTTTYTVGGMVSGLSGSGLVLQNNSGNSTSISSDGSFVFSIGIAEGSSYNVTVFSQPTSPSQTCVVSNGSGTMGTTNVADVTINCTTNTYTIGGNVSGLTGTGLVLQNNGGDDVTIDADGGFVFATALTDGATYAITISSQPTSYPGQVCSITNGSGTLSGSDITAISVSCATERTISGTISGLTGTSTVELQNNGGDNLSAGNGSFTFATGLAEGSDYTVTVLTQPTAGQQYCSVIDGNGAVPVGSDVTTVTVNCVAGLYNVVETMQSTCYNSITGSAAVCAGSGYDADYMGNTTSYTLNADGKVVYDNVTGLAWTQTSDITGNGVIDDSDKLTQPNAVSYCAGLSYGGHSWRLPSIKELYSLIDFRGTDPSGYLGTDTSVLTPFIDDTVFGVGFGDTSVGDRIIDGQVASSTLYISPLGTIMGADTMFGVNFIDGRIKGYPYNTPANNPKTFYVYCVSGNPDYGANSFTDNGDGTITDSATGLMWQQSDYHSTDFEDAIANCEAATTGGVSIWRLPNVKELQSIVDYSRAPDYTSSAAIDPMFTSTSFSNEVGATDWGYYWASTTHIGYPNIGDIGTYVSFGRALGYFDNGSGLEVTDVHGAGAQRSNTKQSHAIDVSSANVGFGVFYYKGPQGDISRYDNHVRCVTDVP